ncbi:hypothetical protein PENTCL1PPCAC_21525, partial [Pristionchus entomophagus]
LSQLSRASDRMIRLNSRDVDEGDVSSDEPVWQGDTTSLNNDHSADSVTFCQLFRFASRRDKTAYSIASFISVLLGFVTPLWIYVFTCVTTIYIEEKEPIGNKNFLWKVCSFALLYGIGFIVSFILEFAQYFLLTWTSERIAQRCRRAFVEAVLSHDTSSYNTRTGELNSQLGSHIDSMKEGLGDRIGLFV